MFDLAHYIDDTSKLRHLFGDLEPWELTESAEVLITDALSNFPFDNWIRREGALIHQSASVSTAAFLSGPVIVGPKATVSAGVTLRAGAWLGEGVSIGPHCEIKSSYVCRGSRIAHLNYVGNSVVGADVNVEAGAVVANHWNERVMSAITLYVGGESIVTGVSKFGAVIGDRSRIGANAVTSPGTVLAAGSVVGRLELVDQSQLRANQAVRSHSGAKDQR